jgi:maltose O-acetyltransferase
VKRQLCMQLYYQLARRLPVSYRSRCAKGLRRWLCERLFAECGQSVNVETGASFGDGSRVRVGDRSGLGVNASVGWITIGKDVMIGPDLLAINRNHAHSRLDTPMITQGYEPEREIVIEDDVWIGARVILLPGVRIGRGSIVGAGAVVSASLPPWSVAGGVPARVLRLRTDAIPVPALHSQGSE